LIRQFKIFLENHEMPNLLLFAYICGFTSKQNTILT
jgi:hypothetical protein